MIGGEGKVQGHYHPGSTNEYPTHNAFHIHYPSVVLHSSFEVFRVQAVRMKLNIQSCVPPTLIAHLSDQAH